MFSVTLAVTAVAIIGSLLLTYQLTPTVFADGATIEVTTTDDELNNDGDCSLREAITSANVDVSIDACVSGSGDDTILLQESVIYVLTISDDRSPEDDNLSGDLDITADLTIEGRNSTIDGGHREPNQVAEFRRIIHAHEADVVLNDLTITGGVPPRFGSNRVGGGILNDNGSLTLNRSRVVGNGSISLPAFDTAGSGGGIASSGNLTLNESLVAFNTSSNGDQPNTLG